MVNFYGWGSHPWCKWPSKCIFWTHWALSDFCPLHWIWWWATWNGTVKKFGQEFETIGQCPMRSNLNGGVISRILPHHTLHNKSSWSSSSSDCILVRCWCLQKCCLVDHRRLTEEGLRLHNGPTCPLSKTSKCFATRAKKSIDPGEAALRAHLHCFSASAYRPRSH